MFTGLACRLATWYRGDGGRRAFHEGPVWGLASVDKRSRRKTVGPFTGAQRANRLRNMPPE